MSAASNGDRLPDGWSDLVDLCDDMIEEAEDEAEIANRQWTRQALTALRSVLDRQGTLKGNKSP